MAGAAALGGVSGGIVASRLSDRRAGLHREIENLVAATRFVDTHEHLPDEADRLSVQGVPCDDWSVLLSHYLISDLESVGLSSTERSRLLGREMDPGDKWKIVEPYWDQVRHSGYARAVLESTSALYGVDSLHSGTISRLQEGYERLRRPGMYDEILVRQAGIESCQVNNLGLPFRETRQPLLLMQDLSMQTMHIEPDVEGLSRMAGIAVADLSDWHAVIRWWFERYGAFAVAVKSQAAYSRALNFAKVGPEKAAPVFARVLRGERPSAEDRKTLEDHLFWYCVRQADRFELPVKIHTGHLAERTWLAPRLVASHAREAAELCRRSPQTRFVFLHIAYPYWSELIPVARQHANAYLEMSWSWISDPVGSREFLKRYLASAPASKVLPFGGDYIPVECVVGHAAIARRGVTGALAEMVEEGSLSARQAFDLIEPLMRGNARAIFQLADKERALAAAPWVASTATRDSIET